LRQTFVRRRHGGNCPCRGVKDGQWHRFSPEFLNCPGRGRASATRTGLHAVTNTTIARGTGSTHAVAEARACRVRPATFPILTIRQGCQPASSATRALMTIESAAPLILKWASASRPSGEWNEDDFDVLADGIVVGRIFKANASPVGASWM
jgi:hypothetical protein